MRRTGFLGVKGMRKTSAPDSILDRFDLGRAEGILRIFSFDPRTGRVFRYVETKNLVLYGGADILALLVAGQADYRVRTMYAEFRNLVDPSDPIVPPVFDRSGGIAYYNGLSSDPDTDFIRLALNVSPSFASSGSNYANNVVTFFGQTEGLSGFHGKTFGESANSAVFGAALVASPDSADQSRDIVFSRAYAGIDKVPKQSGQEIGITWSIRFN